MPLLPGFEGLVLMLLAYCDESGTHDGAPVVLWGGYIAEQDVWARFSDAWRARLAEDGLDHFHMAPFRYRRGHFATLPIAARERLEHDLAALIGAHPMSGVVAAVHRPGFDQALQGEHREVFGSSVPFGFGASLSEWMRYRRENRPDEPIGLIYGEGDERQIRAMLDLFKAQEWPSPFHSLSFNVMRQQPGIQAADMLLWCVNRELKRGLEGDGKFRIEAGSTLSHLAHHGLDLRLIGSDAASRLAGVDIETVR